MAPPPIKQGGSVMPCTLPQLGLEIIALVLMTKIAIIVLQLKANEKWDGAPPLTVKRPRPLHQRTKTTTTMKTVIHLLK